MINRKRLIDRFVKYTGFNTQAKYDQPKSPSSHGQFELAKAVLAELKEAGVQDLVLTDECILYGTIPSNVQNTVPTVGYLAHFDTSTDSPGGPVKVRFVENYQGGEITYPANPNAKLDYSNSPHLKEYIGHTIITSDGTSLLGGDDKAGIAVLVELANYYKENPKTPHGKIRLAIIPDEEIGVGTDKLDLKTFGADVAYTIDGGGMGEMDVVSFNGFMGTIDVEGYVAFPGYGKGIYINAIQVFSKFVAQMEDGRWPQNCDKRQPIWWLDEISGGVGKVAAKVFLRDFDLDGIEKQKSILDNIKQKVLKEFPKAKININIAKSYLNYKYELDKDPRVVAYAEEAMKKIDIKPVHNYLRGGNDACHLCSKGLISTNLFIGMQNMHSILEWNTVETIEGALKTVISLSEVWVDKSK